MMESSWTSLLFTLVILVVAVLATIAKDFEVAFICVAIWRVEALRRDLVMSDVHFLYKEDEEND